MFTHIIIAIDQDQGMSEVNPVTVYTLFLVGCKVYSL